MRRDNRKIYIMLIIILMLTVTVGYALLNTTLNINGKSSISKNTWNIYFDNIQIKNGSTGEVKTPTISVQTTIDFEVLLNLPGDYYEFSVDVVNNGTIDAMIDSVEKTPDLTTAQQKYLNYIIEYQNGEQITTKQLVKKDDFVRLKVRVEYKEDLTASELPSEDETLNLGFTVNYVQSDVTGINVIDNGVYNPVKVISGNGTNVSDEICIEDECFYVISSDEDSITMLSKYNLYVGGKYENYQGILYGDEATGLQDSNMLGYVHYDLPIHGGVDYSDDNYWHSGGLKSQYGSSYPAYVYDSNSKLYNYIENYKNYFINLGINILDARLIKREELISLGCNANSKTCISAPSWVYSTSYWTGIAYDSLGIMHVASDGVFNLYNYYEKYSYGVRPVIEILKNEFNL